MQCVVYKIYTRRPQAKTKVNTIQWYYGPYKQDSTSTKKRLVLGQDQCTGYRTDGTSGTIGRGVAKLYNYAHTKYTYVLMYLYTKLSKCSFYTKLVKFFSYFIILKGVIIDPIQVKAIKEQPKFKLYKDIQVFLNFANFYK